MQGWGSDVQCLLGRCIHHRCPFSVAMIPDKNKNCILYCRVSTTKSAQQGESLDTQDGILSKFAEDRTWKAVPDGRVFRETFSGRKDARPVLDEIFEYIEQNPGKVNYFVFRVIDRFTRGGSYSYDTIKKRLASHGVEMVDTYGVIQPVKNTLEPYGFEYEWSKTSPSEIAESVIANTAKAEVTNILTRIIGREIELTNQGFKVRQAADGFQNKKVLIEGKKKVIQVPDLARAKFFIEMFNLRAVGTHTDKEVVERVNAMGYRTRIVNRWNKTHEKVIGTKGGKPLTTKLLQEIIRRPIYCGVVCEKWTHYKPIKARYEGLVPIEIFNRANRGKVLIKAAPGGLQILYNSQPDKKLRQRLLDNPLFPYKNLVLCPKCYRPFTASCPRGQSGQLFPTYHCSRKHKYIGIPKADFDDSFENFIRQLDLNPTIFDLAETCFLTKYQLRKEEIASLSAGIQESIGELRVEQKSKKDAFVAATSTILRTQLERDIEELEARINSAQNETEEISITEDDIRHFKVAGKYILEHLHELLLNPANSTQKGNVFGLIFDCPPTYTEIVNGTGKVAQSLRYLGADSQNGSLVHQQGLSWNTTINTIRKWIEVFSQIAFSKN